MPVAADVPEARLVVSDVTVTPSAPDPGNTTTVEFTVENSAGSSTGVNVSGVRLRDRTAVDPEVYVEAANVGALSVGDDVTLELATAFDSAGVHDLEIVVETTTEDGSSVVVTRPVTVVVGGVDAAGITDDVQIDARMVDPSELQDDEQVDVGIGAEDILGTATGNGGESDDDEQPRSSLVRIEVTNFGTATARDVVVVPSADGETPSRLAVADVAPGESETALFDPSEFDEPTQFAFTANYTLGTDRKTSETTFEYRPNRGRILLTDVDMVLKDGRLEVTGNAANPGLGEVGGATVAVGEATGVEPAYPARSYFVGTIPGSEFVRFDLTAAVDNANATTVPVTVTYLADGRSYERTVELEYDPRRPDDADGDSGVPLGVIGTLGAAGSVLVVGASLVGWRRWYRGGD